MLGFEDAQILDVTGPFQILEAARTKAGEPAYELELVAPEKGAFRTSCGLTLTASRGIDEMTDEELGHVHSFMVVGGQGTRRLVQDARVISFIQRASAKARRTVSICTGALLLAGAGLLDGKRVATHWAFAGTLRRDFPRIEVDDDAIYLRQGKVWTSAGVTAGMDLALALVEEDLDRETALAIARHLVMFLMRPGGQSQFSAQLAAQAVEDERIARICAHIVETPRGDLSVPSLAARANMSERTFARRFTEATGLTPAHFVERARLDEARRQLTEGALPIETVAHQAGFGQAERMRRAFLRHLGVTPNRYRERFRTAKRPIANSIAPEDRRHVS
ncbi:MAG: helix-turn-helix domain-containing protein [Parvibaculum sedimenti]|uniref:GlxA family transcriptional regulator n=1 Tax=Parvibaculum sedimenti TaxID=2608632 RepID=UPI003BB58FC2